MFMLVWRLPWRPDSLSSSVCHQIISCLEVEQAGLMLGGGGDEQLHERRKLDALFDSPV